MSERRIADAEARRRIDTELATNMLVEAGAGSGKTTKLLDRMIALIRTGQARVGHIAAVTFTRKAAAELSEGFQARLEEELRKDAGDDNEEEVARLQAALDEMDRAFVGTIHAFCARILREHPIEARLDPSFREVFGPEEERLCREAWERHLERLTTDGDPSLARLRSVNIEASRLYLAYRLLVEQPDVEFVGDVREQPAVGGLRDELAALVDAAQELMPERKPEKGWCNLQGKIRTLQQSRWNHGWRDDAVFLDALETVVDHRLKPTYKRWGPHSETIRGIERRLTDFVAPGGEAETAVRHWHAYRYRIVLEFVARAAEAYERERRRRGLVTFNDLLIDTARLLRRSVRARRELGGRFRFLLVDEFQDTDPVQAEILFLLAAEDHQTSDWRDVSTRPGSLFVVGDPKQSIYRFRRADIEVYNQVKERIGRDGEVVSLVTNFRSQPPIEAFVNGVFSDLLPERATAHQAAFAELNAYERGAEHEGVFWYEVAAAGTSGAAIAEADAPLVASWIAKRIADGERVAGDFMVLTYRKHELSTYGVELEKRAVPFQITGAGVDIKDELAELVALLQALVDPQDPIATVAVLVGLFFGIDHDALLAHRMRHDEAGSRGAAFDFTSRAYREVDADASQVTLALHRLRGWWRDSLRLPADVVVGNIADELGLLPYLAGGEAGASNAGALAYALSAVRAAGIAGDTSLRAALDALVEALDADEVEAPLQPGRDDVVRVMNLHKAKGLEANVVILAHPAGVKPQDILSVVRRPEDGDPLGAFVVQQRAGRYGWTRLAAPLEWTDLVEREDPFDKAEDTRLLYVAATRARQELVISHCAKTVKNAAWCPFFPYLEKLAVPLELTATPAPEPAPLEVPAASIAAAAETLAVARAASSRPSYRISSVTKLVKHDASIFTIDQGGLGRAWGNAVHEALEAAARGASGEPLTALCRTALLDNDLPVGENGEPEDLDALVALVRRVHDSETWRRAGAAERRLVEAPFATKDPASESGVSIVEGVIDLAFREADGWVIVDYKTDADAENRDARRDRYKEQVDTYARLFTHVTGEPVKERQLLWVGADLEADVW